MPLHHFSARRGFTGLTVVHMKKLKAMMELIFEGSTEFELVRGSLRKGIELGSFTVSTTAGETLCLFEISLCSTNPFA